MYKYLYVYTYIFVLYVYIFFLYLTTVSRCRRGLFCCYSSAKSHPETEGKKLSRLAAARVSSKGRPPSMYFGSVYPALLLVLSVCLVSAV